MPKLNTMREPALVKLPVVPEGYVQKVLALGLDLATNTGVAMSWQEAGKPGVLSPDNLLLGQWDLSTQSYESGAVRIVRLRRFLDAVNPGIVFYENVRATPPEGKLSRFSAAAALARAATAMEFIGALKGTVAGWCEERGVPCVGLDIGTIKKFATGRGNANKEQMITACNEKFGTDMPIEGYETSGADNIADAAHILDLGLTQYAGGL